MSSLAPIIGAATAGERTFLKRPRCVVAVVPSARGEMARHTFDRRVVARKPSAPPEQRRVHSGFDVKIRENFDIDKVHVVVPRHGDKEVLITRGMVPAGQDDRDAVILAAKRRRRPEAPSAEEAAAKRRKSSSPSNPAPRPAAKQQRRRRAAPTTAQSPISKLIEKGKEALEKRRLEEIARARENFHLELLEVEKAAMPDETIYPEDLEELGLTVFQYAVTPTRKQELLGAG